MQIKMKERKSPVIVEATSHRCAILQSRPFCFLPGHLLYIRVRKVIDRSHCALLSAASGFYFAKLTSIAQDIRPNVLQFTQLIEWATFIAYLRLLRFYYFRVKCLNIGPKILIEERT